MRGDRPALFEGRASLTYREWNEYADLLADAFAGRGLGTDDVIAVRCRNRMEWAVIALACAKIDARLLTLDPDLPSRVLRQRLIASRAAAVIVGDTAPVRIAPALEGLDLRLRTSMDGAFPGFFNFWDLFGPVAQPRFGRIQPSMLAWTSGSGEGLISLPRRRNAPASVSKPPVPEIGASLITIPIHRTWGATQFWAALAAGRAVAFMRAFNGAEALETIRDRRITHWCALPETFLELRRQSADQLPSADTSSLQEVIIGGASAPWMLKTWLVEVFGGIVSEAYGAPEAGMISLLPAASFASKRGSCGRPIRGVAVEIRDASGRRVPVGSIGEIWARTQRTLECDPGFAHGMRRDDEGFVATGDTGCLDSDGFIYVTGRSSTRVGSMDRKAG